MRVFAIIVALSLAWCAHGQTVPAAAYGYQHLQRQQALAVWGVAAPVATLAAQIHQESGWNCAARSWVGALGCAQFMPATAADMGYRYPGSLYPPQPRNARWAFRAQAQYMHDLYAGRGASGAANDCERMAFALAGYNGGEGWVIRDRKQAELSGKPPGLYFGAAELANAGRRPDAKKENAEYPRRILLRNEVVYVHAGFGLGVCQ